VSEEKRKSENLCLFPTLKTCSEKSTSENGRRKMRTNEMVDRYIENEEEKKPFNFFKTQRRVGKNGYGMPESY